VLPRRFTQDQQLHRLADAGNVARLQVQLGQVRPVTLLQGPRMALAAGQSANLLDLGVVLQFGRTVHRVADDGVLQPAFIADHAAGNRA